ASSSSGGSRAKLINQLVGMGFSEKLASKAIDENGEGDLNSIVNSILTYLALEDSPQPQLSTNSDRSSSDYNEAVANDFSDMENWTDDEADVC
ncbi:hypothetical protein C2S52_001490, partial [Perilla frutescens var. hirtella]